MKAVAKVDDPIAHTMETMHTVLRSTIIGHTAKDILANEVELNATLKRALSRQTKSWGVRVKSVEIKEMVLCQSSEKLTKPST